MRTPIIAAALLAATASSAHHGFTGRYDTDKPYFIVGRVEAISVSPPHPTITVSVEATSMVPPAGAERPAELTGAIISVDPQSMGRSVRIEFPPVRAFYDLSGKVKPGDTVEILAIRNCAAPHQLRSQWVRVPGREIVQREGRLSYMARGCAD
jgi:hypothetical protein